MKRLVTRKRRTYRNPLTPEDIERVKTWSGRVVQFTESELAFLRSLGSNDDPQPGTQNREDDAGDTHLVSALRTGVAAMVARMAMRHTSNET